MMALRLIAASVCILLPLAQASLAADPTPGGLLRRAPLAQFEVVAGRITAPQLPRAASRHFPGDNREIKESLTINPSSDEPSLSYRFEAPGREFTVEYRSPGSLTLSDRSAAETVLLDQQDHEPLRLTIESADTSSREFRAKSLWQLLMFHSVAADRLLPRLECLRMGWQLSEQTAEIEKALHDGLPSDWPMDRVTWSRCVDDLGSEDFQLRQLADKCLRTDGLAAAAYLQTIDRSRLAPEQVRRIAKILEATRHETDVPANVAQSYLYDTEVWCHFLRDDSLESRIKAASHLNALLGRPLRYDPSAELSLRTAQIKAIEDMLRR